MRHVSLSLALLVTLAACSQDAPDPAASTSAEATAEPIATTTPTEGATPSEEVDDPEALLPQGLGDIAVGKAPPATLHKDASQTSDGCQTYSDKARRIYAMSDGKVIARITAMIGSSVRTARGIAVGATEAAVRKAYPDAVETPHKYSEAPAKYLDWRPGDGTSGLRFEIDGEGKVAMIHAGREPELEYVEGCG